MILVQQCPIDLQLRGDRVVGMCHYRDAVLIVTERGQLYELREDGIGGYSAVSRLVARINELEKERGR